MSKQANQKYRKEKAKEHLSKNGLEGAASDYGNMIKPKEKLSDITSPTDNMKR